MRIGFAFLAALALFLPPAAQAAMIDFTDATGDGGQAEQVPAPMPWAGATDIVETRLWVANGTLWTELRSADLASIASTSPGANPVSNPDTMFIVSFTLAGARDSGDWYTRADYQPGNPSPWTYWAEAPCTGSSTGGGCPGGNRAIREDMPGHVDLAAGTVTVGLPFEQFVPGVNATVASAASTIQMVYPTWPVYATDFAEDVNGTVLALHEARGPVSPLSATQQSGRASPAPSGALLAILAIAALAARAAQTSPRRPD